jgi:rare lipoprotein A
MFRTDPRTGVILALALLQPAGCSISPPVTEVEDGAPARSVDVSAIPNAVPRPEPHSKYGNPVSYEVNGKRYYTLRNSIGYQEQGIASWYGTKFHGRRTSSGEAYDMYAMSAAHKTLPLPTYARVTNLRNGRSLVLKINDRGPFHNNRLIDLSYAAAARLGILGQGTGLVRVEALDPRQPQRLAPDQPLAAPPDDPLLYIQIGAFGSPTNADRLRRRLPSDLSENIRIQKAEARIPPVYRVQVGPLRTVEKVDALTQRLAQLGISDIHIVIE